MTILPEKIQVARYRLIQRRPYLATALLAMIPAASEKVPTMAVDRWWRLYFNPATIDTWQVEEVEGVLYHEVAHLLREHPRRMGVLPNEKAAGYAADMEINDDLLSEGVILPEEPVTPESYGFPNGLLAEEYYRLLTNRDDFQGGGRSHRKAEKTSPGGDTPLPPGCGGPCGSAATGRPAPWELPPDDNVVDQGKQRIILRITAEKILQESTLGRGNIPGHWQRWAQQLLSPKVDWRQQLSTEVGRALTHSPGRDNYSYSRPSRRQGQVGNGRVILPAMITLRPTVAVVIDTSASVSEKMLAQGVAEIGGILRTFGCEVSVLSVDAAVHTCQRVFSPRQVQLLGGGGTDMGLGIRAAAQLRPRPDVIVVITDGDTPWPSSPPEGRVPVVALILGDKTPPPPGWIREIRIRCEEK